MVGIADAGRLHSDRQRWGGQGISLTLHPLNAESVR